MNMTIETIEAMSHVVAMKQALEYVEQLERTFGPETEAAKVAEALRLALAVAEPHKWVGLTEQEWERLVELYGDDPDILIRETEAKLRAVNGFSCDATEKNRGKA